MCLFESSEDTGDNAISILQMRKPSLRELSIYIEDIIKMLKFRGTGPESGSF